MPASDSTTVYYSGSRSLQEKRRTHQAHMRPCWAERGTVLADDSLSVSNPIFPEVQLHFLTCAISMIITPPPQYIFLF